MSGTQTHGAARWRAIGTDVHVLTADASAVPVAERLLRRDLDELDRVASRFRADSEVCALAAGTGRAVTVSPLLGDLLDVALAAADETRGALDPTVGSVLVDLGYDRDLATVQRTAVRSVVSLRRRFRWTDLYYDRDARSLTMPPGLLLDLGATAKAYAADRAAARIATRTHTGVLVNLGGDLAVAGPTPADGWPVGICHDVRHPSVDETVVLHRGGLATSSVTARQWRNGATLAHHIVDPSTGAPAASRWRTVTVHAPTCLAANVAATMAIVRDDRALSWIGGRRLAARLVPRQGPVVRVGGWPRGDG